MERGPVGDACTRALGAVAEDVAAGLGLSILEKIWGFLTGARAFIKLLVLTVPVAGSALL